MKTEISLIELRYLLDELQALSMSRIDKVYNPSRDALLLEIYSRTLGKKYLAVRAGCVLYISVNKLTAPKQPSSFCMSLRKHIGKSHISSVEQYDADRIIILTLKRHDEEKKLVIELFKRGNIVLCDSEFKIINSLFRDRTRKIFPGIKYVFPSSRQNPYALTSHLFKNIIANTKYSSLVKTIASDVAIGGLYAEEVCLMSGINKLANPVTISDAEIESVVDSMNKLLNMQKNPMIVDNQVLPFKIKSVEDELGSAEHFSSFNDALDAFFTKKSELAQTDTKTAAISKNKNRVDNIIIIQKQNLKRTLEKVSDFEKKAELIYKNYALLSELIKELKEARKKYSWSDIKKKLENHNLIKGVDEKSSTIVVDLK